MLILLFAAICGLVGEGVEVWRLRSAGLAMPGLGLRLTLFGLYAAAGGGAAFLAAVFGRRRWRLAAALFAVVLIVPWANFDLLPDAGSTRSIVGSLAIAAVAAVFAWGMAGIPRLSATVLVSIALAGNLSWPQRSLSPAVRQTDAGDRPNIVLFLVDTLRADHLGAYGYERPTSPNMDRLAGQGVRFERVVAQAPWTKPSVASMFTGRFVHGHGVVRSLDTLPTDLPTLAGVLSSVGYRTAAFSANPWITPEFRFDRGFAEFESGRAMGPQLTNAYRAVRRSEAVLKRVGLTLPVSGWLFRWAGRDNVSNTARDAALTRSVIEWLDSTRKDTSPFFLYIHMIGPHDPYDPPESFARAFARSEREPEQLTPPRVETSFERAQELPADRLTRLIDQYDAAIAHADSLVGTMLDEIDRRGLADNTVIVLTSDHGEEFYEHGNWRHGNQLYDEVVRVPLLVRDPRGPRGSVRSDAAMLIDVMPTLLTLAGIGSEDTPEMDGRPLFSGTEPGQRPTFAEHWWFEGGNYVARAVEVGGLKLISAHDEGRGRSGEELYDLRSDAAERFDLLSGGTAPEGQLADLRQVMGHLGGVGPREAVATLDGIDAATEERLRRLGYLGDGAGH